MVKIFFFVKRKYFKFCFESFSRYKVISYCVEFNKFPKFVSTKLGVLRISMDVFHTCIRFLQVERCEDLFYALNKTKQTTTIKKI